MSKQLIIGFAFSLMPDGAPGSYNRELAKRIVRAVDGCEQMPGLIALQWEIADALLLAAPNFIANWYSQNRLVVVTPPRISAEDVQENQLSDYLRSDTSNFGSILANELFKDGSRVTHAQLDRLLDDSTFFEKFDGQVLADLDRPELGELFREYRTLPRREDYPVELGRYQRMRVNRLILESVIPRECGLRRGQYLSTPGVLDAVLDSCIRGGKTIEEVQVVAHPEHAPRCLQQTRYALDTNSDFGKVRSELVPSRSDIPWDSTTAQVWCRSLSNWQTYEAKVQKWLSAQP